MRGMRLVGAVMVIASVLWATGASAQQYTMRAGSIWARGHSIGQGYDKFAELVKQKSNGRVVVQVFHESALGNEREMAESLRLGNLEILGTGGPGLGRFVPEADIPEFPFLYENMAQAMKVWDKFDVELDKISTPKGFKILGSFHQGTRYIISRKPLRSMDDMKGYRLRSPDSPFYIGMIKSWGATPIPMAFAEIYTSLQTGVIDGMEGPPITIWSSKYHEPAKNLILTGHILTGQRMVMNATYYDKLPADVKKIIHEALAEALAWQRDLGQKLEDELVGKIRGASVTVLTPDAAFRSGLVKASHQFNKEFSEKMGAKAVELYGILQKMISETK